MTDAQSTGFEALDDLEIEDERATQTVTLDEVVTTVIMARVTDFFGFFVYAIASALVFPRLFFPMVDPATGTIYSFALFSLAFLARPVGSFASRHIQKRIGRGAKTALAAMILGTSTVAIGLLPGYEQMGWAAPAMLAFLRILQGLGLGGSWDGLSLQLQNAAPEGRKGLYAMIPQLGGPIGFCVAGSLFFVLSGFLTDEEFITWGWRFAFFGVFAVNVVSLFARIRLLQADFGAGDIITEPAPYRELIGTQWKPILLSTFIPLASYALFHMVTVFPLGYELLYTERSIAGILLLQLIGGVLGVISVILSGVLADRYSRRWVRGVSTALIVVLCLTIGTLETMPAVYIILGFILLGFAHGQTGALASGRYPDRYRYSASALSTNLSWIVGAAFAPLCALALTQAFGLWASALYLLSGALVTGIALHISARDEAKAAAAT
ncbi:MAG: MFS transporter [Pseudomonadota bacterium]